MITSVRGPIAVSPRGLCEEIEKVRGTMEREIRFRTRSFPVDTLGYASDAVNDATRSKPNVSTRENNELKIVYSIERHSLRCTNRPEWGRSVLSLSERFRLVSNVFIMRTASDHPRLNSFLRFSRETKTNRLVQNVLSGKSSHEIRHEKP